MRKHFLPVMEARQVLDTSKPFVFLGGTMNGSTWRAKLAPLLSVEFFDPAVPDWTVDDLKTEETAKALSTFQVYAITPKQKGFYGPCELTVAALTSQRPVVLLVLQDDDGVTFDDAQKRSVNAIVELLKKHGSIIDFDNIESLAGFLNIALPKYAEGRPT